MRISKVTAPDDDLLNDRAGAWLGVPEESVALSPSPVGMAQDVSPFMAESTEHGKVERLTARLAHNGKTLSVRLAWEDPDKDDAIDDLDRFADAVAVMFPLADEASALTMGAPEEPVNAWLWKADQAEPYDVIAQGYATSERRPGTASGLRVASRYGDGGWTVVFQRRLPSDDPAFVSLAPGSASQIAFAVWEGANAERSGQKAVSGDFVDLEVEA